MNEIKQQDGLSEAEMEFVPPAVKQQLEAAEALVKSKQEAPVERPLSRVEEENTDAEIPAPPAEATPVVERKPEDWKHKYQVLKGKYDSEIPELGSRLQYLSGTIESQTGLIEELQERIRKAEQNIAKPDAATEAPNVSLLNEADFEGYGEQIVNMVKKLNALAQIAENNKVSAPQTSPGFEQRLASIEQRSHANAELEYFRALDNGIPDWKTLNKDPRFLAWLNQRDPITEIVRMQAIKRGADTFNARQVINIFSAYKREAGLDKPAPTKKDIEGQVQVVPTATGSDSTADVDARNSGKYATKDEFLKAKDLYIKGRLSEENFNKVANRFQTAIRDKKVS